MVLRQLFDSASCTFTYIVGDEAGGEAVLIDPVLEHLARDLEALAESRLALRFTLDTHVHADHVTGALALRQATGATTCVCADCGTWGYQRHLEDGDRIAFGGEAIRVLATPGHTPGSVCYLWRESVFTGDTLLIGGCGRTDFQHGDAAQLYRSITERLFTLPDETRLYPGHDYHGRSSSTIGAERGSNPRLAGKSLAQFVDMMENLVLPMPARIHEAVPANMAGGFIDAAHARGRPA